MFNCDKLASASLGKRCGKIGEYAFFSCESLKSITMPKALKVIAMNAFTYSGLKSVILNDGLQKIGKNDSWIPILKKSDSGVRDNRLEIMHSQTV